MITRRKPKSEPEPMPTEDPRAYDALIRSIREKDRPLLKLLLELEARNGMTPDTPPPDMGDIDTQALDLLEGRYDISIPAKHPHLLALVRHKRAVVARTAELGAERQWLAYIARATGENERLAHEVLENDRETIKTTCTLQRLNKRRHALAKQIKGPIHTFVLALEFPLNPQILLGHGYENCGPTHEFLRVAVMEGIVTEGEIAKWRGDEEGKI